MADSGKGKGGLGGKRKAVQGTLDFGPLAEADFTPLRVHLEREGITIGSLADGCKVGKPYMNRVVNGRRFPSLHLAARLASYLGLTLSQVHQMVKDNTREYKGAK